MLDDMTELTTTAPKELALSCGNDSRSDEVRILGSERVADRLIPEVKLLAVEERLA